MLGKRFEVNGLEVAIGDSYHNVTIARSITNGGAKLELIAFVTPMGITASVFLGLDLLDSAGISTYEFEDRIKLGRMLYSKWFTKLRATTQLDVDPQIAIDYLKSQFEKGDNNA